jgi:hypothetical protein
MQAGKGRFLIPSSSDSPLDWSCPAFAGAVSPLLTAFPVAPRRIRGPTDAFKFPLSNRLGQRYIYWDESI